MLYIHEELPLNDEELSRWQWAETLIDSDEEKGTKPENTITGKETNSSDLRKNIGLEFFNIIQKHCNISLDKLL